MLYNELLELIKKDPEKYEIRYWYELSPMVSPMMMKCIKFDIEAKHEDLMLALKLKAKLIK